MAKSISMSGIQPTGGIHLGNYLGAIKRWVDDQEIYENYYCVVNLHAITMPQDPKTLLENSYNMAALLIACGIDEKKSNLFIQSDVRAHTELAWILSCNTPVGDMQRMTQFKDKSQKVSDKSSIGLGLFTYPTLMAADILLYDTEYVMVGEDQKQHLELTRDIAIRINKNFKEVFTVPKPLIAESGGRVMSLIDPDRKMSKSDENQNACLYLLDSPKDIEKKIKRATTDSEMQITFDKSRKGPYNLLSIYKNITGESEEAIINKFDGKGFGHLKVELAEILVDYLKPIRERYDELISDKTELKAILKRSSDRANEVADKKLALVKDAIGLV